ncbi:hypothetical protein [Thioclava sp. GXIMD2076]|uniref:hypothetical protein n=1 Tax=unclassified Thioclava TaxID=2621713 RepID=UPI0030CED583
MASHQHSIIEKRAVIIPDGLGNTAYCTRVVSLARAPWDTADGKLTDRPETAPRQPTLTNGLARRPISGKAFGNLMCKVIAEELRLLREEAYPAEVFIGQEAQDG